ncbi:MAG TPA: hypothetical protein VN922_19415 [Bacteroidia bacterium]|nr:hypothetical protein [Bacteroidia bacterium]
MTNTKNTPIAVGQILIIKFITDADLQVPCIVTNRTKSFATIRLGKDEVVKTKIHKSITDGSEFVYPYGKYSMCPIARQINTKGN